MRCSIRGYEIIFRQNDTFGSILYSIRSDSVFAHKMLKRRISDKRGKIMGLNEATKLILQGEESADIPANEYIAAFQLCLKNMAHRDTAYTVADVVKWSLQYQDSITRQALAG